ncbi:hypothetical protein QN224_31990 [Sinorhizobium sp. 8-89]|uniref:hypothetical protein n=1 Tax=Sinorhizobium sp. 7-81 TaxID=3049087 RepID=UPI0024C2F213|nr:hypothetical protein [Sinorhizobium sp. 7-81]MDK1389946.1 hypothetical protein [Sinorhizobium sp. 7-81]
MPLIFMHHLFVSGGLVGFVDSTTRQCSAGRAAAFPAKSLNNMQNSPFEALAAQLARLLNLDHGATASAAALKKETTMKTNMSDHSVTELTPEEAAAISGGECCGSVTPPDCPPPPCQDWDIWQQR